LDAPVASHLGREGGRERGRVLSFIFVREGGREGEEEDLPEEAMVTTAVTESNGRPVREKRREGGRTYPKGPW